jgi:hypothetical protein
MTARIAKQIAPNLTTADYDWIAAETALQAAQKLPGGSERFEALKMARLAKEPSC